MRSHHYSPALLGVLFSVFNWAYTIALLGAGPFTDWAGARVAYPAGLAVWSVATALCGLSTAFVPLAVARAFVGIGESPMIASGARVIRETFEERRRALAVGTFFAGNKVGLMVGIPFASVLLFRWGWPWVFFVTGFLGVVWLACWIVSYRPSYRVDAPSQAQTARTSSIRWATLLRYRTTWGIMLGQAGYLYIYYVYATWLPGYLVIARHMSVLNSGFVAALPFLVGIVCTILGGWLSDALIARGARRTIVRKSLAVGGLLAATIFTVLAAVAPPAMTTQAVALLTLSVASYSFTTAVVNAMPIDVAPPHVVSSLVSLQNFGGNLGGSFAPVLTGVLLARTGSFAVPLLVTAAVALVFGCGAFGLVVGDLDRELRPAAP